eukprot:9490718-Pyramimonas_sp.AAC.2
MYTLLLQLATKLARGGALTEPAARVRVCVCVWQVWDVAQQQCKHTLTHHTNKVQSVVWNPAEASVMLTGGFDKTAHVRSPLPSTRALTLSYIHIAKAPVRDFLYTYH